jgi:hypothetical protein
VVVGVGGLKNGDFEHAENGGKIKTRRITYPS